MTSSVDAFTSSSTSFPLTHADGVDFNQLFIEKVKELVGPFFLRLSMIKRGDALGAVSLKPSGIWYANTYALALKSLGDTPIPVRDQMIPASTLYKRLLDAGAFYTVMPPSLFWSTVPHADSPTGAHPSIFEMKRGVPAAAAFRSFQRQLSFLDCRTILQVAINLVLIDVYGEDKFNALAGKVSQIRIGDDTSLFNAQKPIRSLFHRTIEEPRPELVIGQTYYMWNHETYGKKHPHGSDSGLNLVYIGNNKREQPLFIGFGINPEGVTLEEVSNILRASYNEDPIHSSLVLKKSLSDTFEKSWRTLVFCANRKRFELPFDEIREYASGRKDHPELSQEDFVETLLPQVEEIVTEREALKTRTLTRAEFLAREDLFIKPGSAATQYLTVNTVAIRAAFEA